VSHAGSPAPIPITYNLSTMRVLILGGTQEARELKQRLGDRAILALKRTTTFGGAEGLKRYVEAEGITHIVDATHPFATRISANAQQTGATLIRLERSGFAPRPEYTYVPHLKDAPIPPTARVFLTTGHHEIEALEHHPGFFLVRALTPPKILPPDHELLLAKGPFTLEGELALIRTHRLTHLISKDSGGPEAKLEAAARAGLRVILIERPPSSPALATVDEVLQRLAT
jgi:precorrin-6A/cobalt-precorrin-6A reductase